MISLDPYRCSKTFRKGIFVSRHVLRVVRAPKISSVNSALIKGLKALFNHSEARAAEPLLKLSKRENINMTTHVSDRSKFRQVYR